MLSTSVLYKSILADPTHAVEWKITVNGTAYTGDKIAASAGGGDSRPKLGRAAFDGDQPDVGQCYAATFSCAIFEASAAVPRMASVVPAYRLVLGAQASEWITLGTFYIDTRQTDKVTGALILSCFDRMLVGDQTYRDVTAYTTWPQTMSNVVSEICTILGVTLDARTTINSGTGYRVEYPNDLTMREVLGYIAVAHAGNWIITPENKLRLIPLTGGTDTLNLGAAASGLKTAPAFAAWSGVTCWWADEDAYQSGNDTGRVLTCDCPWATQATADGILAVLTGDQYQPYTADGAIIDLALELGDIVTVGRTGETVTGPVWSISITAGALEQADISAPGEDEIDHEYPYESYVDRSLMRKVTLGQSYYGTSISREKGIEIKRSDGTSEATFNSDVFQMSALVNNVMTPRIYFDPLKGDYVFDGALGADAVFTDSLYAEQGDIAELTVDRLSTSKRVRLYNLRSTADDNFVEIQDNYLRFITGTPIEDPNNPGTYLTEQATNRYGQGLYWSEIPDSINADGYPLDEDGNQIYATTTAPTPGTGETLDDYKVMVYQYTELVKAQFAFELESGTYVPILTLGAGDGNGRTKGMLHKSASSFDIGFTDSNGNDMGIHMNSAGYMDLEGIRRTISLDFSNFPLGYFQAAMDGNLAVNYGVDFDANGDPVRIYDSTHSMDVTWW